MQRIHGERGPNTAFALFVGQEASPSFRFDYLTFDALSIMPWLRGCLEERSGPSPVGLRS